MHSLPPFPSLPAFGSGRSLDETYGTREKALAAAAEPLFVSFVCYLALNLMTAVSGSLNRERASTSEVDPIRESTLASARLLSLHFSGQPIVIQV